MIMDVSLPTKIDTAVKHYLQLNAGTNRPFTTLALHLQTLEDDPDWTEGEILEFRGRIIHVLLADSGF